MEIVISENADITTVKLIGKLTTDSAPALEKEYKEKLIKCKNVVLDLERLDYTSSAGLRIFLVMQKNINTLGGTLTVRNVNKTVRDVFEITGFLNILNVE